VIIIKRRVSIEQERPFGMSHVANARRYTCTGCFPFTFIIIVPRLAWAESLIAKRGIRGETDRGMRRDDEVSKQR